MRRAGDLAPSLITPPLFFKTTLFNMPGYGPAARKLRVPSLCVLEADGLYALRAQETLHATQHVELTCGAMAVGLQ